MSFIEEVEAFKSVNNQGCKVRMFLDAQDEKALAKSGKDLITNEQLFEAAKLNTLVAVHKALVNRGYKYSDGTVSNHLRGTCRCALEAAGS
jgi:hypothetical protein